MILLAHKTKTIDDLTYLEQLLSYHPDGACSATFRIITVPPFHLAMIGEPFPTTFIPSRPLSNVRKDGGVLLGRKPNRKVTGKRTVLTRRSGKMHQDATSRMTNELPTFKRLS